MHSEYTLFVHQVAEYDQSVHTGDLVGHFESTYTQMADSTLQNLATELSSKYLFFRTLIVKQRN